MQFLLLKKRNLNIMQVIRLTRKTFITLIKKYQNFKTSVSLYYLQMIVCTNEARYKHVYIS